MHLHRQLAALFIVLALAGVRPGGHGPSRSGGSVYRSGVGPLRQWPLKTRAEHPDHAAVLADLDPELHGLALGISSGVSLGD
jgi:hypothetical protein